MSDISDPGRVGRRDRKRAQKVIDAAYAAGHLTAADRSLRTQRVDSAHTKGDLAIIVRDLTRIAPAAAASATVAADTTPAPTTTPGPQQAQAPTSLGSAIPPDQLRAMSHGRSVPTIDVREAVGSLGVANVKKVRRIILIVVVGFFLLCGLGITGIVTAIFSGINDVANPGGGSTPAQTLNLQTAKGWTELVTAIDKETGTSRVYDAVVYPEYASVNAVADDGAMRYVYRGGKFDLFNSPVTPANGRPIDLADIDADLIAGLPEKTAERQKMPDFDSAYLIVNTVSGQPSIMVYVQQTGRLSRWSIYDLKGNVTGGTPG
ncbi:DUF1707 SHOCT-like domain-containing protein [Aeromicrobium sp.]|uniref:DUF1707 SHOCT-like domain-containing protein n=1 Tax=Aeromicrobium sp. TaxID=1871063 RepID=UPI003C3BD6CD